MAGVVNFIMKHNFEGVQLDAEWGENQHGQQNSYMQGLEHKTGIATPGSKWDGYSGDYSLIFGQNSADGKGNMTGYATYMSQDPVFQGARDYSACQLKASPSRCSGSVNSNQFHLSSDPATLLSVSGHSIVPYPATGASPPPLFNSNPYESLIHQDTRYTGGFMADYDYNDFFQPYLTFQYMHDQTNTQVAPGGLFQGSGATDTGGFLVNCNNPLPERPGSRARSAARPATSPRRHRVDTAFGRRNVEGGPRAFEYDHDNFRVVAGSKGKLWGPFTYDLYGSYYDTSVFVSNANFQSISRVQNALLVSGTAANPTCISGAGCVPYNIFQQGGITPASLSYLNEVGTSRGNTTEAVVEGTATGNLSEYGLKTPYASEGVGIAGGFQWRRDSLVYTPDQNELSNDMSGFGGAAVAVNNALGVTEGYSEVRVPIVQDMRVDA